MGFQRLSARQRVLCLIGPALAIGLLVMARWVLPHVREHPPLAFLFARPCTLKSTVGVPCPLCGGTRATVAAAHGEWARSLALNPAGTALVIALPLLGVWLALGAATGIDLGFRSVRRWLHRPRWGYVIVFGTAALWGYVLLVQCVFKCG